MTQGPSTSLSRLARYAISVAGVFLLALAALAVCFGAEPPAPAGPADPPAPLGFKVAVVDLADVFDRYQKSEVLEKDINRQRDEYEKQAVDRRTEINRLNEELKQLKETSESFQERKLEISRKMAELQTLTKQWREDLDKQYDDYTSQLLEEIDREIQAYGQREGYTLIFKKERPQPDTPRNVQVQLRGVLYHAPALEITDKIVELVNVKYQDEQKKSR